MSGRRKLFIASLAVAVLLVPVFVCLFVAAVDTHGKGFSTIKLFVWDTLLAIARREFEVLHLPGPGWQSVGLPS